MTKKLDFFRKNRIKVIIPGFITLTVLTIGLLATNVRADDSNYYPPIVQKLAEKFNLDVSQVEDVFDEDRDERRADMYAHFAERLNDSVTDGSITEEQKNAILAKHEEIQNQMEELSGLEPEERRTKMQEIHDEFQSWAESEGIDLALIGPMGGFGPHGMKGGFGEGFHHGPMMDE